MHFKMESCDLHTIALLMRYHKPTFLKFLKLALLGALFAIIRAYKGPYFQIMHFRMESCDLLTTALLMRYHKPIFMKFLKLVLLVTLSAIVRACLGPKMQIFKKMKKMSPDIVAIYHKNPKVKVSDVLTGFCCAPKFCDGHTHFQFLTQLKLRKGICSPQITFILRGMYLFNLFCVYSHSVYLIVADRFQRLLRMGQCQINCFSILQFFW